MNIELLPLSKNAYRTNLHCHTTVSDGSMTPEEVKEHYKSLGYSAVCYTDHEVLVDQSDLCDDTFIALHGYEVAIKKDPAQHTSYFMPVYHFNFIAEDQKNLCMPKFYKNNPSVPGAAREWIKRAGQYKEDDLIDHTEYSIEWLNEYLCAVRDAGFLITYNHPEWSLQTERDYIGLEGLHAIEVINGSCSAMNDNTSLHFASMLRNNMKVLPVAGDDNHSIRSCGLGWTVIKADKLSYDALIDAYKKGFCYASEGPDFHGISLEDGNWVIHSSSVCRITMLCHSRHTSVRTNSDGTLTEASFPFEPEKYGAYVRFELRDANGNKAYSPAYYVEDLKKQLNA